MNKPLRRLLAGLGVPQYLIWDRGTALTSRAIRHLLTLLVVLLANCAAPVAAKEVPLTPLWSGAWQTVEGDRCSLRIVDTGARYGRYVYALCTFGAVGVSAETPIAHGVPIPLSRVGTEFGGTQQLATPWGEWTVYAVCDHAGPALYTAVQRFSPPLTLAKTYRALRLDYVTAAELCGVRP